MVLLPTFPILRAGESHYREKTKFPKLAETSSFLRIRSYPASFLSETPNYKRNGSSVGVRSFVKLASRSDPIAGATAARGIRAAPPIHRTVTVARKRGVHLRGSGSREPASGGSTLARVLRSVRSHPASKAVPQKASQRRLTAALPPLGSRRGRYQRVTGLARLRPPTWRRCHHQRGSCQACAKWTRT